MSDETVTTVRCACGSVEIEARGAPILTAACHCDDCQEGARRIERLPGAPPVLDPEGGSAYLLYRKDRIRCTRGEQRLQDIRLKDDSPTRRVVATCCNSAMFLDFSKGHWFSMYRERFPADAPPIGMRVQTKFQSQAPCDTDAIPQHPGYPFSFLFRLIRARLAMLIGR